MNEKTAKVINKYARTSAKAQAQANKWPPEQERYAFRRVKNWVLGVWNSLTHRDKAQFRRMLKEKAK